jgi:2-amino-4-hydroxy-6-hydroxymethyldihydropteridine diphosphokinase
MIEVWVALGANMEGPMDFIAKSIINILKKFHPNCYQVSPLYQSKPWGYTEQSDFFNAVMVLEFLSLNVTAFDFLLGLQSIETSLGRVKSIMNGPRIIDLDLILYGSETSSELTLQLPHPRFLSRSFVVFPMLAINPEVCLPDGRLVRHEAPLFDYSEIKKLSYVWNYSLHTWDKIPSYF